MSHSGISAEQFIRKSASSRYSHGEKPRHLFLERMQRKLSVITKQGCRTAALILYKTAKNYVHAPVSAILM